MFIRYHALCSLQKPPKRIPETLQNWLKNNGCWYEDANVNKRYSSNIDDGRSYENNQSENCTDNDGSSSNEQSGGVIANNEAQFVMHIEDLVAVRQSRKVAIREFFSHLVVRYSDSWFRFLRKAPPGQTDHWQGGKIFVTDEELVNRFSVLFEFLAVLVLFILPLWILQAMNSPSEKLAVITIFVLACLAILSFAMSGSPFQVLAATAGYAYISGLGMVPTDHITDIQLYSLCSYSQFTTLL